MLRFFGKGLRKLHEVKRDERGFTLIELLVVIIIIGILAAIALPLFLAQRGRAHEAAVESDARNAATAYTACYTKFETLAQCDQDTEIAPFGYNGTTGVTMSQVTGTATAPTFTMTWTGGAPVATFANGKVTLTTPAP